MLSHIRERIKINKIKFKYEAGDKERRKSQ